MNQFTPEQEQMQEQLCRQILAAANANDDQVEAALEAPFLYQRIRNEIAVQESHKRLRQPLSIWQAFFSWRWAGAVATVLLLALGLWQWRPQQHVVPAAQPASEPIVAATTQPPPVDELRPQPVALQTAKRALPVARRTTRIRPSASARTGEVTTEFIPLSYVADANNAGGHLIRVEVTPALLASLGLPLKPERNMEWVKADIVLGDDGLARAIRFVQ